ncbi:LPXTG cell wall anchor domain-containing protein [Bacillus sp. MRMR6]|uniref:LPXTG cell wall anchor domain-containing protein n=1 Tax=Bacillus sp. MRMR6 TaxID=1928617 RepID=UPI0026DBA74A|nr:LPXTG cell wall anchor domain-containing protein [Bacillus sp. MRMR6]
MLVQKLAGTTPDENEGSQPVPGTNPEEENGDTKDPVGTTPTPTEDTTGNDKSAKDTNNKLPNTATNMYNLLGLGLLLLAVGAAWLVRQRRARME